ncbi:MAG: beta strand repeat-containing protein [Phycisphaerae bacterium]
MRRCIRNGRWLSSATLVSGIALAAAQASGATVTLSWTGTVSTAWNDGRNWGQGSAAVYPNNGIGGNLYNAFIGAPAPANLSIPSGVGITIEALTTGASGVLNISQGDVLKLNGTLTNDGAISLLTGSISFLANNALTGAGALTLHGTTDITGNLTQASNHTINGTGSINAGLTNDGTVNANVAGQILFVYHNMTNHHLMEATTGGNLTIASATITQSDTGQIYADSNSTVSLNIARVVGGILDTAPTGVINCVNVSGRTTLTDVTNNGILNVVRNVAVNVAGASLVNNGLITVNSDRFNFADVSFLSFAANVTLSGTGTVRLKGGGSVSDGPITQAANHTIEGWGTFSPTIGTTNTNNGTVNANVANQTLLVSYIDNNHLLEATNGGNLLIFGDIHQSATGQLFAGDTSTVTLYNPSVTGGTLNASGNGTFQANYGTTLLTNLTNNAPVYVTDGLDLAGTQFTNNSLLAYLPGGVGHITAGTLTNSGTIAVSSDSMHFNQALSFGANCLLTGSGSLTLSDDGSSASSISTEFGVTLTQDTLHTLAGSGQFTGNLTNNGTLNANVAGRTLYLAGAVTNNGLARASNGGTLQFDPGTLTNAAGATLTGGNFEVDAGSTLSIPVALQTNAANVTLDGADASFPALNSLTTNAGRLVLRNGATFSPDAAVDNSGTILVGSGASLSTPQLTLNAGLLAGDGTVSAPVVAGGPHTVSVGLPGTNSPASLALASLSTNANTTLEFDLTAPATGPASSVNDTLVIAGNLALNGGTLQLASAPAGAASLGYYKIIQYGTLSGAPSSLVLPAGADHILFTLDTHRDPGFIDLHKGFIGDANDDGKVDLTDLSVVLNHFGEATSRWTDGNFDGAATVNLTDLSYVLNNFGLSAGISGTVSPTTSAIPEPATLALFAPLVWSTALTRRRR